MRSTLGNAENSRGFIIYMPTRRIVRENVMLNERSRSSSIGGKGMIIKVRILTTTNAISISLFFEITGSCAANLD